MSRRGRGNKEKNVGDCVAENLATDIEKLMINRHKLMCPFPVPAMDVYNLMWSDKQRDAMEVLKGTGALRIATQFNITDVPAPEGGDKLRIIVTCDPAVPMSRDTHLPLVRLPDEMQALITPWIPEWLRYRDETNSLTSKAKQVGRVCSTWGQVVRIWPELQGFLGEWGREKVHKAKVKSPYPENALDHDGELYDDLKPEAFVPFTDMIAESLMLPVIDDLIHVGQVAT